MAPETDPAVAAETPPCARCKTAPGTITGRNDHLCSACFLTYVRSKPIKRMDPFRVRHSAARSSDAAPRLLLPFSGGVSSLALLEVLAGQMRSQKQRVNRTGYRLLVVLVDDSAITGSGGDARRKQFAEAERRFACEELQFVAVPLQDVYAYTKEGAKRTEDIALEAAAHIRKERLEQLVKSFRTPTSSADLLSILLHRFIITLALHHGCKTILFGHSTTRLAEITLAETSKGRGGSLPWMTNDGPVPFPPSAQNVAVDLLYPMRDILRKELSTYVRHTEALLDLELPAEITSAPVSAKSQSIDAVVKQYFESLEDSFPGIVANVVKTVGKLNMPQAEEEGWCRICGLPRDLIAELDRVHLDGEDDGGGRTEDMCSGCARSVEETNEIEWPL
ncbi:hypothetical protein DFH27DRAFT_5948 [Peziza echinospora]|nr:hypothetical protein DFH27DRAFT_5948 [Peziza echinospora]